VVYGDDLTQGDEPLHADAGGEQWECGWQGSCRVAKDRQQYRQAAGVVRSQGLDHAPTRLQRAAWHGLSYLVIQQ